MHPHISQPPKPMMIPPAQAPQDAKSQHFQAGIPRKPATMYPNRGTPTKTPSPISRLAPPPKPVNPASQQEQHDLIVSMLPLVKTVVGRIAITLPSHISQEDLLSAGLMGLMDAVQRYDASKGCSLKNYVAIRIRGAVLDELRNMDWAPRSVHKLARDFRKIQMELEQRLGREASEAEMAQEMKISLEELDKLLDTIRPTSFISLQDVRSHRDGAGDDLLQEECIADPNSPTPLANTLDSESHALVVDAIKTLNPTEQKVLALYYYEGLRLKEIAEALSVTESRVSQIHTLAVQRLRCKIEQAQKR
jgi:RNA polymerase sigma factor FliA